MAKIIRTIDGDRLDVLCFQNYGRLRGVVEAVLEANPGLADVEQPFSAGVKINLPDLPTRAVEKPIKLWS